MRKGEKEGKGESGCSPEVGALGCFYHKVPSTLWEKRYFALPSALTRLIGSAPEPRSPDKRPPRQSAAEMHASDLLARLGNGRIVVVHPAPSSMSADAVHPLGLVTSLRK